MTTTLAPPPNSPPPAARPAPKPRPDRPSGAILAPPRLLRPQRQGDHDDAPRKRLWTPDVTRRDAILGSKSAFLVSLAVAMILDGIMVYFYALWQIGPVT